MKSPENSPEAVGAKRSMAAPRRSWWGGVGGLGSGDGHWEGDGGGLHSGEGHWDTDAGALGSGGGYWRGGEGGGPATGHRRWKTAAAGLGSRDERAGCGEGGELASGDAQEGGGLRLGDRVGLHPTGFRAKVLPAAGGGRWKRGSWGMLCSPKV